MSLSQTHWFWVGNVETNDKLDVHISMEVVDVAISLGLHKNLQHLYSQRTYVRILFVDFSLAFNTIVPELLYTKLAKLTVAELFCLWITNFLADKKAVCEVRKAHHSTSLTISTGALRCSCADGHRTGPCPVNVNLNVYCPWNKDCLADLWG